MSSVFRRSSVYRLPVDLTEAGPMEVRGQRSVISKSGELLSGAALRDYAKSRGLCEICLKTTTHRKERKKNGILGYTTDWHPLTTVDPIAGHTIVYKGYCLQPTCWRINQVKEKLGDTQSINKVRESDQRLLCRRPSTRRLALSNATVDSETSRSEKGLLIRSNSDLSQTTTERRCLSDSGRFCTSIDIAVASLDSKPNAPRRRATFRKTLSSESVVQDTNHAARRSTLRRQFSGRSIQHQRKLVERSASDRSNRPSIERQLSSHSSKGSRTSHRMSLRRDLSDSTHSGTSRSSILRSFVRQQKIQRTRSNEELVRVTSSSKHSMDDKELRKSFRLSEKQLDRDLKSLQGFDLSSDGSSTSTSEEEPVKKSEVRQIRKSFELPAKLFQEVSKDFSKDHGGSSAEDRRIRKSFRLSAKLLKQDLKEIQRETASSGESDNESSTVSETDEISALLASLPTESESSRQPDRRSNSSRSQRRPTRLSSISMTSMNEQSSHHASFHSESNATAAQNNAETDLVLALHRVSKAVRGLSYTTDEGKLWRELRQSCTIGSSTVLEKSGIATLFCLMNNNDEKVIETASSIAIYLIKQLESPPDIPGELVATVLKNLSRQAMVAVYRIVEMLVKRSKKTFSIELLSQGGLRYMVRDVYDPNEPSIVNATISVIQCVLDVIDNTEIQNSGDMLREAALCAFWNHNNDEGTVMMSTSLLAGLTSTTDAIDRSPNAVVSVVHEAIRPYSNPILLANGFRLLAYACKECHGDFVDTETVATVITKLDCENQEATIEGLTLLSVLSSRDCGPLIATEELIKTMDSVLERHARVTRIVGLVFQTISNMMETETTQARMLTSTVVHALITALNHLDGNETFIKSVLRLMKLGLERGNDATLIRKHASQFVPRLIACSGKAPHFSQLAQSVMCRLYDPKNGFNESSKVSPEAA